MTKPHSEHTWQNIIDDLMRQGVSNVFPAATLIIQQNGQLLFHRAYGWINPQDKCWPVTPESIFDLASLTKLFTATAFMTLVDAGKTTLETPVGEVVTEFNGYYPLQPGIDPHTKKPLPQDPSLMKGKANGDLITFFHLLTHTSGLAAWDELCRLDKHSGPPHELPADERRRRLSTFLTAPRFVQQPGKQFLYSDLGFILLGEAIERLAGMPLDEYIRHAVLKPLQATSIHFNPTTHGISKSHIAPTELCQWRQRRVWGEVHDENSACLGGVAGHAGLFGTARHVAALGQLFLDNGGEILTSASATAMVQNQTIPQHAHRGLGWQLYETTGPPAPSFTHRFGHTGFTGTSLWVDQQRRLVVTLLSNRVYFGRNPEPITRFRLRLHETITNVIPAPMDNRT